MAEKLLRIIQMFSKEDLSQFLHKNGRSDFEEILMNGEINNGEKFLNLIELQMIKWKIPLSTKRQILFFLAEVKQDPQNFLEKEQIEKYGVLNRRQSFRATKTDFREKLEQVITIVKPPTEAKPIKKSPLPPRPTMKETKPQPSPSPPLEEYLAMDQGRKENYASHYDESGYLVPIEVPKEDEEATYEPPPSDKIITNFAHSVNQRTQQPQHFDKSTAFGTLPRPTPISVRAPLALPRDSTDERGYIRGPKDLASSYDSHADARPPLFPRVVQKNQRHISSRPLVSTPSPTPLAQVPKAEETESEEEEVDYEPIDDDHETPTKISSSQSSLESHTGSLSHRLLGFLKKSKKLDTPKSDSIEKGKKPDIPKSDPIEINTNSLERKPISKSSSVERHSPSMRAHSPRYMSRPLPPLPSSPKNLKPPSTEEVIDEPPEEYENVNRRKLSRGTKLYDSEEPLEAYENIEQQKKVPTPEVQDDEPLEPYENIQRRPSAESIERANNSRAVNLKQSVTSGGKHKPENSSVEDEPSTTYGNIEENIKPKYPENYEQFLLEKSKIGKRPLPLPPTSLPQIKLDDGFLPQRTDDHEDEPEEYGQYLFNLNDEPFYRNTDRKGARLLLYDLGDGAFLFRPSKKFFLTISLKYHGKYFNLGIEKTSNNKIRLNTSGANMSPEFATLRDFVEHFTREQITFEHQGVVIETLLSTTLPPNRF